MNLFNKLKSFISKGEATQLPSTSISLFKVEVTYKGSRLLLSLMWNFNAPNTIVIALDGDRICSLLSSEECEDIFAFALNAAKAHKDLKMEGEKVATLNKLDKLLED